MNGASSLPFFLIRCVSRLSIFRRIVSDMNYMLVCVLSNAQSVHSMLNNREYGIVCIQYYLTQTRPKFELRHFHHIACQLACVSMSMSIDMYYKIARTDFHISFHVQTVISAA